MTTRRDFIDAIRAEPGDDLPRLTALPSSS